jgi:general secretion pathway protein E/type IV pilus assembly protein PilB
VAKQNHKILTIEDPVEYQIRGVNQIQVHPKIGLTFSSGLRSILRHDPDVILVGEIRDQETAISAMQASLTGHLVLSTLHTNDSASAFIRLIDMGIEPYLVSSTIEAVLAQRLVRKLCRSCAISEQVVTRSLPAGFPRSAADITTIRLPGGCRDCGGSGYSGRIGIYELLVPDSDLRRMINDSVSDFKIQACAATREFRSLRQSGWERVIAGITSIDEVIRVTGDIYDEIPNLCNLGHSGATRDERGTA